jgi:hypothetical protein
MRQSCASGIVYYSIEAVYQCAMFQGSSVAVRRFSYLFVHENVNSHVTK